MGKRTRLASWLRRLAATIFPECDQTTAILAFRKVAMARTPSLTHETRVLPNLPPRFPEIALVDFESDKLFHAAPLRSDGGVSNAKKRIEHRTSAHYTVQSNTIIR